MSALGEPGSVKGVPLKQWLDWISKNDTSQKVLLPMLQRGSVWKTSQILDLWDSVLRGMPIGALMISLPSKKVKKSYVDMSTKEKVESEDAIAVIDGQQRCLALLAGWPVRQYDQRLWVDFADKPQAGHLFRLRLSTRNQPFGSSRETPDQKLSWEHRRRAQDAFFKLNDKSVEIKVENAFPYSPLFSLPCDVRELVSLWHQPESSEETWIKNVMAKIKSIKAPNGETAELIDVFATRDVETRTRIEQKVEEFARSLTLLDRAEVPLIILPEYLFKEHDGDEEGSTTVTQPPLAILFQRVGSNATKLSDADYVYAVLKHLCPEVHTYVEDLLAHKPNNINVAAMLTPTELVMAAVRLTIAKMGDDNPQERIQDADNPSKEDFHRYIKREGFLNDFLGIIGSVGPMSMLFRTINNYISYRGGRDIGMPAQAYPHLGPYLVHTLLRLAQIGFITDVVPIEDKSSCRKELLRLALYWMICVDDSAKASRIAFKIIRDTSQCPPEDLCSIIAQGIVQGGAGCNIERPADLFEMDNLVRCSSNSEIEVIVGTRRFVPKPENSADLRLRNFYKRWWQPWTYHHPILLWLQRGYITSRLKNDIVSKGRDEDTAYDYDHILPYAEWGDWRGGGKEVLPVYFQKEEKRHAYVIGNALGNVRVWSARDNLSDGDKTPADKLKLRGDGQEIYLQNGRNILRDSGITQNQTEFWLKASSSSEQDKRRWTVERARAFQVAVEMRTFDLYKITFDELDFSEWKGMFVDKNAYS